MNRWSLELSLVRDMVAGPKWRAQLNAVLNQTDVRPYVVLLATRAAVARPTEIRKELDAAEANMLDIVAIEFDVGASHALRGTQEHQVIKARRAGGSSAVDSRPEDDLRKALNYRVKETLHRHRDLAHAWTRNVLPTVSFWRDTWPDYFPIIDGDTFGGSMVLTARGGSGKSVLTAHCLKRLLEDPTVYPIICVSDLLRNALWEIPRFLGARSASELPQHLEALAERHRQRVVFVVDGLDQIVVPGDPGQNSLVESINLLSTTSRLIASCRKEYWDTVYAPRLSLTEIEVDDLNPRQVAIVLSRHEHLEFDPSNELLQIPFFLDLTLAKAAVWQSVPATETEFLQQVWSDAVSGDSPGRQGDVLPDNVGRKRILEALAEIQLDQLTYDVSKNELRNRASLGDTFEQGLRSLKSDGTLVERPGIGGASASIRLRHDLLDSFSMVRVLYSSPHRDESCKQLCRRADKDCAWTVLSTLVRAAHDYGDEALKRLLFEESLFILDHKKCNEGEMARAWSVTHILKACFAQLFSYILECLAGERAESLARGHAGNCIARVSRLNPGASVTQEAASTLASAFMVLREGYVHDAERAVPILAQALGIWDLRARFIGALAKYRTEAARQAILDYAEEELHQHNDPGSLLYVAEELRHFNHPSAIDLLHKLFHSPQLPKTIRRVAAESLNHLRPGLVETPPREEAEIIQGLAPKEPSGERYSDWRIVQDHAIYVRDKARLGVSFGQAIIRALVGALRHDQIYVRRAVAQALACFDAAPARDALLNELLENVVPIEVREACFEGLNVQWQRCPDAGARQNFRGLLLRAGRAAEQESNGVARELFQLAQTMHVHDWLADTHAIEVVESLSVAGPVQITSNLVETDAAPIHDHAMKELEDHDGADVGPSHEPKFRVAEIVRADDQSIQVQLAPTTWTMGKSFHNAVMKDARRFLRDEGGAWIEPLRLGRDRLPGLAVVHVIVMTADSKVLFVQRSQQVGYAPGHWSASYEEQITADDLRQGDENAIAHAAQRGFREEFGGHLTFSTIRPLSAVLELDNLNLAVVLLALANGSVNEIRERWLTDPRPSHY